MKNLHSILDEHAALCEQTWQLILEENRLLKTSGLPPDENFLDKKRRLVSRLDASLSALREQGPKGRAEIPECRIIMEKAQQIILKTLLLDRENEQLLLKCTMLAKPAAKAAKPSATHTIANQIRLSLLFGKKYSEGDDCNRKKRKTNRFTITVLVICYLCVFYLCCEARHFAFLKIFPTLQRLLHTGKGETHVPENLSPAVVVPHNEQHGGRTAGNNDTEEATRNSNSGANSYNN
jgi:hypothetical protein